MSVTTEGLMYKSVNSDLGLSLDEDYGAVQLFI